MLIVSEDYLYHGLSNYYRQRKVFGYLAVDKDLILAQSSEQPSWNRQVSSCYPRKNNIFWVGERLSFFFKAMVVNDSTPFRDHKCRSRPCLRHSRGPQLSNAFRKKRDSQSQVQSVKEAHKSSSLRSKFGRCLIAEYKYADWRRDKTSLEGNRKRI